MVTELPARRDLCDDYLRQATLVDFRGSNLSDAGSIPAISTPTIVQHNVLDNVVEMPGIEPGSERLDPRKSTSVAC